MGETQQRRWYFDFISPFAYLQFQDLDRLPGDFPQLRPVLFAGLLAHVGQLGPAEIPGKRRFTYRHVLWRARQRAIPMRFPPAHPFPPLSALRLSLALGATREVVGSVFGFIWRDGRDPETDFHGLCQALGLQPAEGRRLCSEEAVKEALRHNTDEAVAVGVFGVPTLAIGEELFWGDDATGMARAWLADPAAFEDDEMRRVSSLPASVQRRRG